MESYDYFNYHNEPGMMGYMGHSAGTQALSLIFMFATIAGMWMVFKKAGEHGWAAIIPFYNLYILFKITWGKPLLFLVIFVPVVNVIFIIITYVKLAYAFGKGAAWAIGLIFLTPVFICLLGFGSNAVYYGVPLTGGGYMHPGGKGNQQENQGQWNQSYQDMGYQYKYDNRKGQSGFCANCGSSLEPTDRICPSCKTPRQ